MKNSILTFLAAAVLAVAFPVATRGQALVTLTTPARSFTYGGLGRYLGYAFAPVSNLTVYALGVADHPDSDDSAPGDGFGDTEHVVRLEDGVGNLLASASVCGSTRSPLVDGFRYAPLPRPITLNAGERYQVAAYFFRDGDDNFSTNNGISTVAVLEGDPIARPRHFGPNLLLAPLTGPRLSAELLGPGQLRLSWPANVCFYQLEFTSDLSGADWTAVTADATVDNGRIVVTVDASGATRFYRLRKR